MKKIISTWIIALLIITLCIPQSVFALVTDADLPKENAGAVWEIKLGEGYAAAPTPPLLLGQYIYAGAANKLYKIDKDTGIIVKTSGNLAGKVGYAMMPPVYGNGMIYISVGNGQIQALDPDTLALKWTSSARTGATNSPLIYDDASKSLFTGTWSNKDEGGEYICLDAATGKFKWSIANSDGFYWSGAYIGSSYVIFGSESVYQTTDSTIYSVDKVTGNIITSISAVGNIRSTMVGDSDHVYALTQSARLYKLDIDSDGTIESSTYTAISGASTGKPTMYGDNLYFGTSTKTIDIYSMSDFSKIDSISMPGYPQAEILLKDNGRDSMDIYSTYNSNTGGIARVTLNDGSWTVDEDFFVPTNTQFCTSPLICGDDGTIYYKNDSGYLMAVNIPEKIKAVKPSVTSSSYKSLKISWTKMSNSSGYEIYRSTDNKTFKIVKTCSSGVTQFTDTGLTTGKKYYYKIRAKYVGSDNVTRMSQYSSASNGKPALKKPSIKTKKGKKYITLTWKKVSGASGYVIYRATKKNGKYKKVKTIKKGSVKKWSNKKLKSKKKYYYKIKAYRKVSGKKVYSVYSNISYKKTK